MNEWGYTTCGDAPAIITPDEFRALTGGKLSSTDATVRAMLAAVSSAVRGYCGWHVTPELECSFTGEADGGLVRLPAMLVSDVSRVTVQGRELSPDQYEWSKDGIIRIRCCCASRWGSLHVHYTAGTDSAGALAAVVAQMASNALVAAPGIASEHAGQVGLTYNQTANGVSGGVSLLGRDAALLEPWRLVRV